MILDLMTPVTVMTALYAGCHRCHHVTTFDKAFWHDSEKQPHPQYLLMHGRSSTDDSGDSGDIL